MNGDQREARSVPRTKPTPARGRALGYWEPDSGRNTARYDGYSHRRSSRAKIISRGFAGSSIRNNVERDFLSFVDALQPRAFDCADVHEDILAAIIWLDEAEAFLAVEPLHGSLRHRAHNRCLRQGPLKSLAGMDGQKRAGFLRKSVPAGRCHLSECPALRQPARLQTIGSGSARTRPSRSERNNG